RCRRTIYLFYFVLADSASALQSTAAVKVTDKKSGLFQEKLFFQGLSYDDEICVILCSLEKIIASPVILSVIDYADGNPTNLPKFPNKNIDLIYLSDLAYGSIGSADSCRIL